nr:hypothetical protein [Tanacetum cinerariifolium]
WWVSSRSFFDGVIREPPRIPSLVNQHSRDDVPEDIYQRMEEQDRLLKELHEKNDAHDKMFNQMNQFLQGMQVGTMSQAKKGPIVGFPQGGPTMFPTQTSNDGAQATPTYPTLFYQPISSRYPSLYPATPHIMTLRAQQGFVSWSSTYAIIYPRPQYGSLHYRDVGGVISNVMNQERRECHLNIFLQSPYMHFPATTVAPKKQVDKSKNKTRNAKVAAFDLGKAIVDDNATNDKVMITGARATDDYVFFMNVDSNKREHYVECMTFLYNPQPVF